MELERVGRNAPCPCGSRNKAKRCCLQPGRILMQVPTDRIFEVLRQEIALGFQGMDSESVIELFQKACDLTISHISLQLSLPEPVPAAIERALIALDAHDEDALADALDDAARELDTVERRLELAGSIGALLAEGNVEIDVALAAGFDLFGLGRSEVLRASIVQSFAALVNDLRAQAKLIAAK